MLEPLLVMMREKYKRSPDPDFQVFDDAGYFVCKGIAIPDVPEYIVEANSMKLLYGGKTLWEEKIVIPDRFPHPRYFLVFYSRNDWKWFGNFNTPFNADECNSSAVINLFINPFDAVLYENAVAILEQTPPDEVLQWFKRKRVCLKETRLVHSVYNRLTEDLEVELVK